MDSANDPGGRPCRGPGSSPTPNPRSPLVDARARARPVPGGARASTPPRPRPRRRGNPSLALASASGPPSRARRSRPSPTARTRRYPGGRRTRPGRRREVGEELVVAPPAPRARRDPPPRPGEGLLRERVRRAALVRRRDRVRAVDVLSHSWHGTPAERSWDVGGGETRRGYGGEGKDVSRTTTPTRNVRETFADGRDGVRVATRGGESSANPSAAARPRLRPSRGYRSVASRGTDLVLFAVHGRRLRARAVARLAQMRSMMPPREPVRLVDLHVARLAQMRAVVIAVHDRPRGVAEVAGDHTRAGFRGRRRPRGVQDDALERAFAPLVGTLRLEFEFPEGWITPRRGPRRWTRARARRNPTPPLALRNDRGPNARPVRPGVASTREWRGKGRRNSCHISTWKARDTATNG